MVNMFRNRPERSSARSVLPGIAWFFARAFRYQRLHRDPNTFLRDEEGLLNGPGAKNGLTWEQVRYPSADDPEPARREAGKRVVPRLWAEDLPAAQSAK
jgi:hypothetical protein